METKQQSEALEYFKKNATDWARKGSTRSENEFNIIQHRNDFVLKVIKNRTKTDLTLDLGCGTGDLVCEIASGGTSALGVDFAEEMIDLANERKGKAKCDNAKFECCSIFDFDFEPNKYDVISANGLIEYISYKDLQQLLKLSLESLKMGGSLVLGSRNRLFNIFSLNEFTQEEIESNSITTLLREAILIANSKDIKEIEGFETVPLQTENQTHQKTGIEVTTRYQFTPAQLMNILKDSGFETVEICPVHIHGATPKFKDQNPVVHANISNLLQKYTNTSLIAQASSFMIHGKKR